MWEIAQKELTKSRWPTEFDETGNSFERVGQLDLNKNHAETFLNDVNFSKTICGIEKWLVEE